MKRFPYTSPHIHRLVDAIRGIESPQGPTGQLHRFVQFHLCALHEGLARYPVWPIESKLTGRNLGFTPLAQGEQDTHHPAETAACLAYEEAVGAAEPFQDVLTEVFVALLGEPANGKCQHFTPWNLARAITHFETETEPFPGIRFADVCCGSGSLVMARLHSWVGRHGREAAKDWAVFAGDIDPLCVAITSLQVLANQLVHSACLGWAVVNVANAISRDEKNGFASAHVESCPRLWASEMTQ